jgi:serine/threonine protein phosphatase PrpC
MQAFAESTREQSFESEAFENEPFDAEVALEHASVALAALGGGHDRAAVIHDGGRALLVVADGAGGTTGASRASSLVVEVVRELVARRERPIGAVGLAQVLERLDMLLLANRHAGESTAVLVEVVGDVFWGASVGDSGAWLVHGGHHLELTARQHRKSRLGSGYARPVRFGPLPLCGTLLVATDGLFDCAPPDALAGKVTDDGLDAIARALIDEVRVPGGGLRDDVGLVLARPR